MRSNARGRQVKRAIGRCGSGATLSPSPDAETLLARAMTRLSLSARAYHRILKVARTIADLAGSATITTAHVAEAIQFRRFERTG